MTRTLELKIDLEELDLVGDGLRDAVVENVAEHVRADFAELRDEVRSIIKQRVAELLTPQIDALFEKTFQETDCYGTVRTGGKTLTLQEIMLNQAQVWLSEKVDSQGRGRPNAYGDTPYTRAQWMVKAAADDCIKQVLGPELDKAKKEFAAAITGRLSDVFRKALAEAAKFGT